MSNKRWPSDIVYKFYANETEGEMFRYGDLVLIRKGPEIKSPEYIDPIAVAGFQNLDDVFLIKATTNPLKIHEFEQGLGGTYVLLTDAEESKGVFTDKEIEAIRGTPVHLVFIKNYTKTKTIDLSRYPHRCPKCAGPAYIGLSQIDCLGGCK